ncbi:MAG: acetate--CoA ligase [Candidatus Thermoplasmatota archaeon]|jgi:acetyl-CoA synthetase|nr:acetate--CoA ligase [Candidatus Thermoplasmatota archaeon]MCL5794598.1 acetate--CoA ligase [Candidatus Thermoplasmatota archaeon]
MKAQDENREVLPTGERYHHGIALYESVYRESLENPNGFWSKAASILDWDRKWDKILDDTNAPFYRWFLNGKLNVCYNAVDRHAKSGNRNKAAYIWVGEGGEEKIITFEGLYRRVNNLSNALINLGIEKGDKILIYLPMILEAPVAMLAAARIGAVFSFVFAGFGASAISERINDAKAKIVITADGGYRNGKILDLKRTIDEALVSTSSVQNVIVVRRSGHQVEMEDGRDIWYHDLVRDGSKYVAPVELESNDPLFILYTSGTTGKPKGVVHGNGGYAVWVANTMKWAFNPNDTDRWWCAADIGWITGHSYIVFAPLILGLTSIMYEGSITYPSPDRLWDIAEKYGVNILYTSPTAIRTLMRYGEKYVKMHDLSTIRVLGTVGEPINPPAWRWYHENIGSSKAPIIDTYWQTETGGFVISPSLGLGLPPLKPGSATFPMPGIDPVILDEEGNEARIGEKGLIAYRRPWPGMLLTLHNDPERFVKTYFDRFKGKYYCGDYAVKDSDGYYWLLGRADEVLKVAGHRLGTIEIEDALLSSREVAEAAVFGKPDEVKGEVIVAFIVVKNEFRGISDIASGLRKQIKSELGPIYVPEEIHIAETLPKTRSGKIMRRVIKAVFLDEVPGDVSTLESSASVDEIRAAIESFRKQAQ